MLGWLTSMKPTNPHKLPPKWLKRTLSGNLQYLYKKRPKEGLLEIRIQH